MGHETYANKFALRPLAHGRRGMVATASPLATLAGLRMFARGGNAVDAIVAAAAAVGVAEPYMSGLAGCGVALVSRPGQAPRALNFLGYAPAAARREALPQAARDTGILSVAVPGNLAGWGRLLADHGTVSLAEALEPAIELAEAGPPMTVFDRQMFGEHQQNLNPEGVRTYLHEGRVPESGRPVVQRELAASFRAIARDGVGALYEGELGQALARDMRELGGLITLDDLKRYPGTLQWTDALVTSYRGVSVYAPPPPASALQILQTLNGMAGWELGRMEHLGPDHLAVIAEAARAARMDTERYAGDPAFVDVPVARLLGDERTARIREEMRARLERRPARPPAAAAAIRGGSASTTHLAACDASGLAVNITHSLGGGFGSGVVVRGTGIALNNALHWTSSDPKHPNALAPGKRHEWPVAPLHLHRDGAFWTTIGTPGSYGILVTTVQVLANVVDFGLNLQDAIAAPRFRWADEAIDPLPAETLRIESRVPESSRRALEERGYTLDVQGPWTMRVGGVQGVQRDAATGWLAGGADPRRNGYAMGW
jgi:gamma-glutamyltranspeptidase / glutathione hydrolase